MTELKFCQLGKTLINYILWIDEYLWDFKWKIIENFVYNELSTHKESFEKINFWQNTNNTEIDFLLIDNFDKKIIPIEVKSWTKYIIPKSILSFIWKYKKSVSHSIITTASLHKKRQENWKDFIFVPYILIFKFREYLETSS